MSFSLFGLYFTFIFGSLLIAISFWLDPLLAYIQRLRHEKEYSSLEWKTNGLLQLQRLGYESLGSGTWYHCTDTVPITDPQEVLMTLNLANSKHPKLCSSTSVSAMECNSEYRGSGRNTETEQLSLLEGGRGA